MVLEIVEDMVAEDMAVVMDIPEVTTVVVHQTGAPFRRMIIIPYEFQIC